MALYFLHDGGINPLYANAGTKTGEVAFKKCDQEDQPNWHSTFPYKHIKKCIKADEQGCCVNTNPALAVGDVISLATIPAGSSIEHIKWDIKLADPTLEFDLEIRKTATPLVAGTAIAGATSLGNEVADNAVNVHEYFSRYGAACTTKDCFDGSTVNGKGLDHGFVAMIIKALPTGAPAGCSTSPSRFGNFEGCFNFVVTDLR